MEAMNEDKNRDKTLYVVSGFMRTGTSMMMKALEAGGLKTAYVQERNNLVEAFKDDYYNPNPNGLYELSRTEYRKLGFPRDYKGKLIKALHTSVPNMAVMEDGIRVVFMRRDQEEIRQSYLAFFNASIQHPIFDIGFQERMDLIVEQIRNRKDVLSCTELWYREVVGNSRSSLEKLKQEGWPIDIDKSLYAIDPSLLRYKREELSV